VARDSFQGETSDEAREAVLRRLMPKALKVLEEKNEARDRIRGEPRSG
jgi:hypothetical protein